MQSGKKIMSASFQVFLFYREYWKQSHILYVIGFQISYTLTTFDWLYIKIFYKKTFVQSSVELIVDSNE